MLRYPDDKLPSEVAAIMLKAMNEERGTVAGLASLLENLDDDLGWTDSECSYTTTKGISPLITVDRESAIRLQPTSPY
jgi:hypothetical protein